MSDEELADALLEFWGRHAPEGIPARPDRGYLMKIVPLIRERLKTLADAAPLIPFFFADNVEYDTGQLVQKRMNAEGTRAALSRAAVALSELASFDSDSIEGALRPLADDMGIKVGQLLGSIRVATTGLKVSPPLFESLEVLGRERSLAAIEAAAARL
jgi:glutamyl-tRNA synthetase